MDARKNFVLSTIAGSIAPPDQKVCLAGSL
jgi:hypothetical protein